MKFSISFIFKYIDGKEDKIEGLKKNKMFEGLYESRIKQVYIFLLKYF